MKEQGFFKRWFHGMRNLSQRRQLEAYVCFSWGNLIGFFGGFLTMLVWMIGASDYKFWWTVLVLFIAFLVTIVDLVGKHQQIKALDDIEGQLEKFDRVKV